jgi:hypothetical protein
VLQSISLTTGQKSVTEYRDKSLKKRPMISEGNWVDRFEQTTIVSSAETQKPLNYKVYTALSSGPFIIIKIKRKHVRSFERDPEACHAIRP